MTRAERLRDKRMQEVVRLRALGRSLRQIARYLDVTHTTVRRDLERWQELEHPAGTNVPKNGTNVPADRSTPNVFDLRSKRRTAP